MNLISTTWVETRQKGSCTTSSRGCPLPSPYRSPSEEELRLRRQRGFASVESRSIATMSSRELLRIKICGHSRRVGTRQSHAHCDQQPRQITRIIGSNLRYGLTTSHWTDIEYKRSSFIQLALYQVGIDDLNTSLESLTSPRSSAQLAAVVGKYNHSYGGLSCLTRVKPEGAKSSEIP